MYRQIKNRLVYGEPYRSEVSVHPEDMAIGNELRGDIRSAHDIPVKVLTDPDRERGVPVQVIYLSGYLNRQLRGLRRFPWLGTHRALCHRLYRD